MRRRAVRTSVGCAVLVGERPLPLGPDEIRTGEGMILREVTLEVQSLLWSNPDVERELPRRLPYLAFGWLYKGGSPEKSTPMSAEDSPRLELGHSYVLPFNFDECRQDLGAGYRWRGLGGDSDMPADGGVVGGGEFEGRDVTVSEFKDKVAVAGGVRDIMAGRPVTDLTVVLNGVAATPPDERLEPRPC